jgi:HEAT repeat protein
MMKKRRKGEKEKRRFIQSFFCLFFAFFACFAGKISAQDLDSLNNQIRFGTSEVKRNALFEIRNLKSENASRLALPALLDADEIVRATAVSSVIYLPKDEAANALLPLLDDKSEYVRRETAYALGKVGSSNATAKLIQISQKDKIAEVRNACVIALGEIGDENAIQSLTQILQKTPKPDEDFLRRSAAHSIGQIAQIIQIKQSYAVTPESFLPEKYKSLTLEKYQNLSEKFPQFRATVPVLIKVLQTQKESADTKREAAFAIGAIGDNSAMPILQANLNNQDYYLAEICKESIKKISTVNSVE